MWGMVRNHPFQDGNKRVAYAVTLTFLRVNGLTIVATESEEFTLLIDIAQHLTVEQVSEWMRERRADYNPPGRGK
ncbi:type II toxin-antitoxin system death-on-curing family toxin [Nitrolancea hollandica]|uniref:Death-on-curing family protein n=1 Tax=Nitrolancea hollandica Lb TaxID=1129897 RepID=I4EGS3_9BACT